MRFLTVLLFSTYVLLSGTVHAEESNEVLVGSLTQHFTNFGGVSEKFNNKVSADGTLIANPMVAWRIIQYEGLIYTSSALFGGENSIGELMGGVAASTGFRVDHVRLGLAVGGYLQNEQKFRDRDISDISVPIGSTLGFAPIAGVEVSIDIPIEKSVYGTIYTLITPILSTTTLGIGWNF